MGKYIGVLVITAALFLAANCARHQSPAAITEIELYTGSVTITPTFTFTIIPIYTYTHTYTCTITYTRTPANTPTITPTFTYTYTHTHTNTITDTGTPTITRTITPTFTYTFTATSSNTPLPTPMPTATNIGAVEGGANIYGTMGHTDSNCYSCNLSLNCISVELIPLGWIYSSECPGGASGTSYGFSNVPIGTYIVLGHTIVVTDGGNYQVPHHCVNYTGCPNF
jgi:hypothetical protein